MRSDTIKSAHGKNIAQTSSHDQSHNFILIGPMKTSSHNGKQSTQRINCFIRFPESDVVTNRMVEIKKDKLPHGNAISIGSGKPLCVYAKGAKNVARNPSSSLMCVGFIYF